MVLNKVLHWLVLGGLLLLALTPLLVSTSMFFPFITGKGFAFRIMVEIVFGLFVTLAFIDKEYRPKFSWITKSILFFTLALLVADLLGENVYKSIWRNYERMEGFVLLIHLAMYYIVISSFFKTNEIWNRFFNTSIIASFLMSLYGILQLIGKIAINQGGVRVDATFGNSTYLAIYLVFHIFLCLYMLTSRVRETWLKWSYAAVITLELIILYFTATRGAILGLIGGLLLAGILIAWKERENKTLRKSATWVIGVVFVLVVGFMFLRGTSFVQNSPVLSRFSTLGISEFKTQGRYFVWPMAVKGVVERPLFGWGQENFNLVFNKYYDPGLFGQEEWFDRTHNVVLDWLIAGGIVGLLAYLSIYFALFYYIWRKESLLSVAEKSVFTGMISAYVFHNIFVFDNLISYIIFFSILAYIHSVNTVRKEGIGKFHYKTFSDEAVNYGVLPVVAVLTIAMIYFINVPAIRANQKLIEAITPQQEGGLEKNLASFKEVYGYDSFAFSEATEQLIQVTMQIYSSGTAVPDAMKKEFYDLAKSKIEEKVAESPHDARYLVFAGTFFNRFGQYAEAEKYLTRALAESPKKQSIYFELGTSYLGLGQQQKMFDLFKQAYDLKPTSLESKTIYAIGAIYAKNEKVLSEMYAQIDPSVIISDNRFLKAYADVGDYNTAISILSTRIKNDPANRQNKLSLASLYVSIGQKQKAIDIIRQMIVDDPTFKAEGEGYIIQIQKS